MTRLHVLEELQSVLDRKLSLQYLVHGLFKALSGESFHKAAGTAVVLNEDPL